MDLMCIGELLVDFAPMREPWTYRANPGGAPANVAVAAARNGLDTGFCGMVGDDGFGRMLLEALAENGVAFLGPAPTAHATTTLAFVSLDARGERSFTFARKPGADTLLRPADVRREDIASSRMLHAGSCSLSAEPARSATLHALRRARELGVLTSFDVNYRDVMWNGDEDACAAAVREALPCIDLLKVSDDEAGIFGDTDAFMEECFSEGVAFIVETRGADGAMLFRDGKPALESSGIPVAVRDTTGAGDAFWGAFLSRLLLDGSPANVLETPDETLLAALECANAAGALAVEREGAFPPPLRK